jgi:hypothetical protein
MMPLLWNWIPPNYVTANVGDFISNSGNPREDLKQGIRDSKKGAHLSGPLPGEKL